MNLHTTAPASSAALPGPSLALWERIIRHAQAAARLGQVVLSVTTSFQALAVARQLLDHPPEGRADDCVAALVVSHHRLADLHLQEGALDLAAEQLAQAHEALMALLQSGARDADLQQAAWRHSRETHAALLHYLVTHGPHAAIARGLRAGCVAFAGGASLAHVAEPRQRAAHFFLND